MDLAVGAEGVDAGRAVAVAQARALEHDPDVLGVLAGVVVAQRLAVRLARQHVGEHDVEAVGAGAVVALDLDRAHGPGDVVVRLGVREVGTGAHDCGSEEAAGDGDGAEESGGLGLAAGEERVHVFTFVGLLFGMPSQHGCRVWSAARCAGKGRNPARVELAA